MNRVISPVACRLGHFLNPRFSQNAKNLFKSLNGFGCVPPDIKMGLIILFSRACGMPNKISKFSLLELKCFPITCETQFSLHLYATVAVSTAVDQKLYKPELIETETNRTLLYDE